MHLIYKPAPGEGPEPKRIGRPFDLTVTPGQVWQMEREEMARALIKAVPQVHECTADGDLLPDDPPPPSVSYDANSEGPPQEAPLYDGGVE